jgi:hypothetical protein
VGVIDETGSELMQIRSRAPGSRRFGMLAAIDLIEIGITCFDRHLAAIGHRVARIDRKIQDSAFKFWTIGLDRSHASAPHNLDRDVLADASSFCDWRRASSAAARRSIS